MKSKLPKAKLFTYQYRDIYPKLQIFSSRRLFFYIYKQILITLITLFMLKKLVKLNNQRKYLLSINETPHNFRPNSFSVIKYLIFLG